MGEGLTHPGAAAGRGDAVMLLQVQRRWFSPRSSIGRLYVNGLYHSFTLEDADRELQGQSVLKWKVKNQTAIPRGRYPVIVNRSNRFSALATKRAGHPVDVFLPLLLNVSGFDGVRIHPGNGPQHTEGCILVGNTRAVDWVSSSRAAFDALLPKIEHALARGDTVAIEVGDDSDRVEVA